MISIAYAQEAANAAAAQGSIIQQFLPMAVIIIAAYFLFLRPQMKRTKEHRAMVDALQKGDEVVTQGGITGRVVKVGEAYFSLEVSSGVEIIVQRAAVQLVLPKGTLKSVV
jgi:preprotein translocase subunit YajC